MGSLGLVARSMVLPALVFAAGAVFAMKGCWPVGAGCFADGGHPELRTYAKDKVWAEKLKAGGYILYIRHAQRDKWNDVTGFDALELATGTDGEKASYNRAVCLTPRGVEEAKLLGAGLRMGEVRIDKVISSPSCRARQTAMHAFGKVDGVRNSLLHRTAVMQDQHEAFAKDLRKLIDGLVPAPGANIAITAHAGTFRFDKGLLLDVNETGRDPDMREEGGFVVLERKDGKLIARHVFLTVANFINASVKLPLGDSRVASH